MARLSQFFETVRGDDGRERLKVSLRGAPLTRLPLTNKGTSFTEKERMELGLEGLLPPYVTTLEEQLDRTYFAFQSEPTRLAKYTYLRGLQERKETPYYAPIQKPIVEMLPIIYTPTVGDAVVHASSIYRGARGLSLSPSNVARVKQCVHNHMFDDVRIIVATDSSAIRGIGDQGWGGQAIAIGKLALYTVGGGVSPFQSLPIGLDVGTDREDLLKSPTYLGLRRKRMRGAEYLELMDKVVDAISERWPRALIQWEDLSKDTAFDVLDRYRKRVPSFNDDIQGTGAVALAGLVGARALRGRKLKDEVVVVYGAGAGGAGVAWVIQQGMVREGITLEEARARVLVLDSKGLRVEGAAMESHKSPLRERPAAVAGWAGGPIDLLTTIQKGKATV